MDEDEELEIDEEKLSTTPPGNGYESLTLWGGNLSNSQGGSPGVYSSGSFSQTGSQILSQRRGTVQSGTSLGLHVPTFTELGCCSLPSPLPGSALPTTLQSQFLSLDTLMNNSSPESSPQDNTGNSTTPSLGGSNSNGLRNSHTNLETSSPLHFLAQASMAFQEESSGPQETKVKQTSSSSPFSQLKSSGSLNSPSKLSSSPAFTPTETKERITVVPVSFTLSLKLHKENGNCLPVELMKPFARKCKNRECNNLGGQIGKPRSIYCSKRCQSREQNLRQGRIKNIRPFSPSQNLEGQPVSSSAVSLSNTSSSPRYSTTSPSPPSPLHTKISPPSPLSSSSAFSPVR